METVLQGMCLHNVFFLCYCFRQTNASNGHSEWEAEGPAEVSGRPLQVAKTHKWIVIYSIRALIKAALEHLFIE
jgi:hypothetical protein